MDYTFVLDTLYDRLPEIMRWSGAIARRMRNHPIAVSGKSSGNPTTDALTLADLTIQELLVGAMRDQLFLPQMCSVQAEESVGDLDRFAPGSPWVIGIDPIDGTRQYRDKTGNAYSIIVHLRKHNDFIFSLVFLPELGEHGTWLSVCKGSIRLGPDDLMSRAADALNDIQPLPRQPNQSKRIYVARFDTHCQDVIRELAAVGLEGVDAEQVTDCVFERLARGEFAGCLARSPNVYDFPVAVHLIRTLGGADRSVQDGRPIDFTQPRLDERTQMLRLPGTYACAVRPEDIDKLCRVGSQFDRSASRP
jgi:3'(2'), 5'-bisphosphate nucleotidase